MAALNSCWAPCEDLGVNAGFKARLVCVCKCVSVGGWGFAVGWVAGVRWGQEVVQSPSSCLKGDGTADVYFCMWECVWCCARRACRLCIGRGS